MFIAHLLFAHFVADYPLQTNWLIIRKGQSWDGLALHGLIVFIMTIIVVVAYLPALLLPIVILGIVHTCQDRVKIYTGPRIKIHPFIPYMIDQLLHYTLIVAIQLVVTNWLIPQPSKEEVILMAVGAVAIAATRFYDVTWWANWLDMIPYMNRWQIFGFAERLAMVAVSSAGLFFLAPLCVLPRVMVAWSLHIPIWKQKRGLLEVGIGIVFSIGLGLALRALIIG